MKSRLKIAVWHNLPSGGGKRALHGHIAGLIARGHHVEAWCPETADETYLPLSKLVREHRLPFKDPAKENGRWFRLKSKLRVEHRALLAEMDGHSQACAEAMLRGDFDLVFAAPCRYFLVPRLGYFLRESGLPTSLYLQEPNRSRYEAMPELPWIAPSAPEAGQSFPSRWKRRAGDYLEHRRLRIGARRELEDAKAYDLILVNSYFSRETIVRVFGLDARVCYLGYDADRFRRIDPPPSRERFIIGLGSMHRIKGVDTAIETVACLPPPRPPLVWVANSEDPVYRRDMEALAAHTQVDFQVRSRIGDGALVDLLNRAAVMLYTSRLEPFGYAPIEANACGVPVVAVAEGGIRETVSDEVNGALCDRDPQALANAIQRLLYDPALAAEQGEVGERLARERWSPELSITRLENHLQRLLKMKQPR